MDTKSEVGSPVVIKGQVIAGEDLVISGRIEGSVAVAGHALIVRAGAHLVADVEAGPSTSRETSPGCSARRS